MSAATKAARDMIPAQVRAKSLASMAADIGQDLVHIGYERSPGVYSEGALESIADARQLLDFIEAAIRGEAG